MISFLDLKFRPLFSEASTLEGIKKGGVSSCHLGGGPPFAEVVRGKVGSLVKHPGLRASELEQGDLDLFPEAWCRVVEDGRLAVNCYALEEQPLGSTEVTAWLGRRR